MPSFFCTSVQRPLTRAMLIAGLFLSTTANAQEQTGTVLQAMAQSWAKDAVLKAQRAAYVPPGSRLWGRSRIGMRCVDGISRWNVTLPVTVRAMGEAWVVRNQVNSGANISESDVTRGEVDWAEEQSPVLADKTAWLGQTASRTLTTGQAMRQGMVRPAQVFQAGASVKIVAQGPGFQISSEAQALSAGVIGQQARVRMDNGRVASGTVLDMRTVKIDL